MYNMVRIKLGVNMDYGTCKCGRPFNKHDKYNNQKLCSKCRREEAAKIRNAKYIAEIEAKGFDVIEYKGSKERAVKVRCKDCGYEKDSYYKNIVKNGRKCKCKYPKAIQKLILSKQTRDVLKPVGREFRVSGIYKITIGEAIYIGSSCNIQNRLASHVRAIRDGKHTTKMLTAYDNYQSIEFEVVEVTDDLYAREQYYIDTLKPELNTLDSAINPMQDIKLKYAKLYGEKNPSCSITNEEAFEAVRELLDNKNADEVASKVGIGVHTVRDISSGKSFKWLEDSEVGAEYKKLMLTKGGMAYNRIYSILTRLVNKESNKMIAEIENVDKSQVGNVAKAKNKYMQRLKEHDMDIKELYSKLGGES